MRSNFFGEKIAQPTDAFDAVMEAWDFPTIVCADLEPEADETFKFGGELATVDGDRFSFDGFESLDAAKAFAKQFVKDEADIQVLG